MSRCTMIAVLSLALSGISLAQTTGLPGLNNYTISGLGSGSTSCTTLTLTPGFHTFDVSCLPGATVSYFVNIVPCAPSSIIGCQGSSIDLQLSPFPIFVISLSAGFGSTSLPVTLGPGLNFSTQCIVNIFGCPPWFTQAYNVQT